MPYRGPLRAALTAVLLWFCSPVGVAFAQSPAPAPQPQAWELGEVRRVALDGAAGPDRVELPLDLDAPAYLLVELEKRGVDVQLVLLDPDGGELAASTAPAGPWTEGLLVALTHGAGRHVLVAATKDDEVGGGHVLLRLLERRRAAPDDARRAVLERRRIEVMTDFEAGSLAPEEAAGALAEMAEEMGALGQPKRRCVLLLDLGAVHERANRPEAAESVLLEAVALRRELGDPAGIAEALDRLARLQRNTLRTAEASRTIEEAHRFAVESGDLRLVGTIDNSRGLVLRRSQDLPGAIDAYRSAALHFRSVDEPLDEAIALQNLGLTIRATGDLAKGCPAVETATQLLAELRFDDPGLLLNRGICLRARGLVDAAFRAYQKAYDLAEVQGSPDNRGMADLHMGTLLSELGENDRAARILRQAIERLNPVRRAHVASAHINLGWIDIEEERPDAAEREFLRALELGDATTEAEALRGHGAALAAQGHSAQALGVLRQALALTRQGGGAKRSEVETLRKIGVLQMEVGQLDEAHAALTAALAAALGGEPAVVGAASSDLAHLEASLGRYDASLRHIERAIEIRESLRDEVGSPELRATYLSGWREDFSLLLDLLRRAGRPAHELLEVSERAHARTLQELLWEARSRPAGDPPVELRQEQLRLEEQLDALVRRQAAALEQDGALQDRIDEVVDELKTVEWRMRSPASGSSAAAPLSLPEIQGLLAEGEALLEFALGEERSFLFVVTHGGLSVYPELPPAATIADMVERMRRALRRPQRAWLPELWSAGHALYVALLAPAEAELAAV